MPFESRAQQRFMFARHPGIAHRWADEMKQSKRKGAKEHPIKSAGLPDRVGKSGGRGASTGVRMVEVRKAADLSMSFDERNIAPAAWLVDYRGRANHRTGTATVGHRFSKVDAAAGVGSPKKVRSTRTAGRQATGMRGLGPTAPSIPKMGAMRDESKCPISPSLVGKAQNPYKLQEHFTRKGRKDLADRAFRVGQRMSRGASGQRELNRDQAYRQMYNTIGNRGEREAAGTRAMRRRGVREDQVYSHMDLMNSLKRQGKLPPEGVVGKGLTSVLRRGSKATGSADAPTVRHGVTRMGTVGVEVEHQGLKAWGANESAAHANLAMAKAARGNVGKADRYYDPEDARHHRMGFEAGALGTAGGVLVLRGLRGAGRSTKLMHRGHKFVENAANQSAKGDPDLKHLARRAGSLRRGVALTPGDLAQIGTGGALAGSSGAIAQRLDHRSNQRWR